MKRVQALTSRRNFQGIISYCSKVRKIDNDVSCLRKAVRGLKTLKAITTYFTEIKTYTKIALLYSHRNIFAE